MSEAEDRNTRLVKRAAFASVGTAITLIAAKAVAYLLTDSVALLSTLVDSLLDAAASTLTLLAVRHARSPADVEHRFGHGKAEALAGLAQAAFISGSAVFIAVQAAQRLLHPRALDHGAVGVFVMLFSMAATVALITYQRRVAKKTGSLAIAGDALHYSTDLLANAAVIVGLLLATRLGWLRADPIISVAIALYILISALHIGRNALDMLMDKELSIADRERIVAAARAVEGVIDVHDLRTRLSGPQVFIQMDVEMTPTLTLLEAHRIVLRVERAIAVVFPDADITLHQDPYGIVESRSDLPLLPPDAPVP